MTTFMLVLSCGLQVLWLVQTKTCWARPGFEPGTSRTLSENHPPRPTSRCVVAKNYCLISKPMHLFSKVAWFYFLEEMRAYMK